MSSHPKLELLTTCSQPLVQDRVHLTPSRGKSMDYTHIFVAVHGIGDQMRNETVRAVATRFARMTHLASDEVLVAPQPLGYFHTDVRDFINVTPVGRALKQNCTLSRIGFSEVYWADVPQTAVDEHHTLDETKAWARTVVSRVRAAFMTPSRSDIPRSDNGQSPDFTLVAEVLDEIIDTIYVLENLTYLAKKVGLFEFKLREMLEQFVGDVQIFTEFESIRHLIIGRFQTALAHIHRKFPGAQLHIVAHSEGTVVSLLGLMLAMAGQCWEYQHSDGTLRSTKPSVLPSWLMQVKGLMTIGSPIDKHLLLWPELFEGFGRRDADNADKQSPIELDLSQAQQKLGSGHIRWHNYYDYGDPVGFKLESVRAWFDFMRFRVFDFREQHDHGFARYLLPGKAHIDYWEDAELFEHFQRWAMNDERTGGGGNPASVPTLESHRSVALISPTLPYLISFALVYAGSAVLHRSVHLFKHPEPDTVQLYYLEQIQDALRAVASLQIQAPRGVASLLQESLGIAMLISGTTLLARWPRLMHQGYRWLAGFGSFVLGAVGYCWFVSADVRQEIGEVVFGFKPLGNCLPGPLVDTICRWRNCLGPCETSFVIGTALMVSLIGLFGARPTIEGLKDGQSHGNDKWQVVASRMKRVFASRKKRRARWFSQGMRPLVVSGVILVLAIVVFQLRKPVTVLSEKDINQINQSVHGLAADKSAPPLLKWLDPQSDAARTASQISRTQEIFTSRPSVVPVLLSGAAFLYLWWLAALIFDLSFVWHRYVRHSVLNKAIRSWCWPKPRNDAER